MSDPANNSSDEFRPRHEQEYQDPHYHDEEPEAQDDDAGRHRWPAKGKASRRLPTRRWYPD